MWPRCCVITCVVQHRGGQASGHVKSRHAAGRELVLHNPTDADNAICRVCNSSFRSTTSIKTHFHRTSLCAYLHFAGALGRQKLRSTQHETCWIGRFGEATLNVRTNTGMIPWAVWISTTLLFNKKNNRERSRQTHPIWSWRRANVPKDVHKNFLIVGMIIRRITCTLLPNCAVFAPILLRSGNLRVSWPANADWLF